MTGRPSKLTEDVIDALAEAIRFGATYEEACRSAGIDYTTFAAWRAGLFPASVPADLREDFIDAIDGAVAHAMIEDLAIIKAASVSNQAGNWRAAAWRLARRHPERFGRSMVDE